MALYPASHLPVSKEKLKSDLTIIVFACNLIKESIRYYSYDGGGISSCKKYKKDIAKALQSHKKALKNDQNTREL